MTQWNEGSLFSFGQMDQLTTAFGSGKQKKALKRRKENKMADESITSAMGTAIDAAVIDQQAQPGWG